MEISFSVFILGQKLHAVRFIIVTYTDNQKNIYSTEVRLWNFILLTY